MSNKKQAKIESKKRAIRQEVCIGTVVLLMFGGILMFANSLIAALLMIFGLCAALWLIAFIVSAITSLWECWKAVLWAFGITKMEGENNVKLQ